ncbi:hypothetical protein [Nocardia asteroides]|uniref:hypothetical protein n=1 Tax=Nocardia asteroides TaxID=1824 RepID=UPI001E531E1E|nr:hypothetical protein [Nocardia asteroides]UGT58921.1 hypothetical protein LTT85_33075 [Nocardia asteroides]
MNIIIEGVTEDFALRILDLAAERGLSICPAGAHGVTVRPVAPGWTVGRAESFLRDLPSVALSIVRAAVDGNGWADSADIRDDGASLRGRTGAISQAIKRGVKAGRLPEDLPAPISPQYDPDNPSYQRTKGYTMPEELLPAFREAFARIDAPR